MLQNVVSETLKCGDKENDWPLHGGDLEAKIAECPAWDRNLNPTQV